MLQNAVDKPTVLTNEESIGDEHIQYTGIKTKGNLTLYLLSGIQTVIDLVLR